MGYILFLRHSMLLKPFFKYRPDLNSFILLSEINNLFSFPSYVDWYTSNDIPF